jgi:hypothetical protein
MSGGLIVVVVGLAEHIEADRENVDVERHRLLPGEAGAVAVLVLEAVPGDHHGRERQARAGWHSNRKHRCFSFR